MCAILQMAGHVTLQISLDVNLLLSKLCPVRGYSTKGWQTMSMQLSMKPYITAGVALVGASVIAVTPIAPHPDLSPPPAVALTTSIENPITVFKPVVIEAGEWLNQTIRSEIADPLPILRQILANQRYTVDQLAQAIRAGGAAIGELVEGLPAALKEAGSLIGQGKINAAIDSLLLSGLNPIMNLIYGVWTPLQPMLERPFKVGQAMVPALFDVGLSVVLATVASTVGIGFDTGSTPLVQQIVISTKAVLASLTSLNPAKIINAVQNGIADVLSNIVLHAEEFTTGTVPFIRMMLVNALKAGQPASVNRTANLAASVATVPDADAPTLTISLPGAEADAGVPTVTPVSNTDAPAEAPAAEVPAEAPVAEAPAEVPAAEAPAEAPVAEAPADDTEAVAEPTEEAEIEEPEEAAPVATRPSLKKAASGKSSPKRAGNPRAAA